MAKKYASKVVSQAKKWLGRKEANGTHKLIIDVYNSHKPLARGYKVKYSDEWCATFVSAVAIKCGFTEIIPTECGCEPMIKLFKKLGCWKESDERTPNPGDIIFYDWDDNGRGDNKGNSDHVGIVEKVTGDTIVVIEGNKGEAVARRYIAVNGRFIRGYGVPKYDKKKAVVTIKKEPAEKEKYSGTFPTLPKRGYLKFGDTGTAVGRMQEFLNWYGGYGLKVDKDFGPLTEIAVEDFQRKEGLVADRLFGKKSLAKAKKVKK